MLRRSSSEAVYCFKNFRHNSLDGRVGDRTQAREQSLVAKFIFVFVVGFSYAVRIKREQIARFQLKDAFFIIFAEHFEHLRRHYPQRQTRRFEPFGFAALVSQQQTIAVSGINVFDKSGLWFEFEQNGCHEFV